MGGGRGENGIQSASISDAAPFQDNEWEQKKNQIHYNQNLTSRPLPIFCDDILIDGKRHFLAREKVWQKNPIIDERMHGHENEACRQRNSEPQHILVGANAHWYPVHPAQIAASTEALTPFFRIARGVKDSINCNEISMIFIENDVWKPTHQNTAIIFMYFQMKFGRADNCLNRCFNAVQKFLTQSLALVFIPCMRSRDVIACFRGENEFMRHFGFCV